MISEDRGRDVAQTLGGREVERNLRENGKGDLGDRK